jgi:hypothetical protein
MHGGQQEQQPNRCDADSLKDTQRARLEAEDELRVPGKAKQTGAGRKAQEVQATPHQLRRTADSASSRSM